MLKRKLIKELSKLDDNCHPAEIEDCVQNVLSSHIDLSKDNGLKAVDEMKQFTPNSLPDDVLLTGRSAVKESLDLSNITGTIIETDPLLEIQNNKFIYILTHKYSDSNDYAFWTNHKEKELIDMLTFIQFRAEDLRGVSASINIDALSNLLKSFMDVTDNGNNKIEGDNLGCVIDMYFEREEKCGKGNAAFLDRMEKAVDLFKLDKLIMDLTNEDLNL